MQRRVLFLQSGCTAQRNRIAQVSELVEPRCWSIHTKPALGSYDIVWVLDPAKVSEIHDTQYRLLVWDFCPELEPKGEAVRLRREAGGMILKHCAHLVLYPDDYVLDPRDAKVGSLDRALVLELADDVLIALRRRI